MEVTDTQVLNIEPHVMTLLVFGPFGSVQMRNKQITLCVLGLTTLNIACDREV